MKKPLVFNYREFEEAKEKLKILEENVEKLLHEKGNLEIRCRIAEMNAYELNQKIHDKLKELLEVEKKMEPVVRCKDCRSYFPEGSCEDNSGYCDHHGHDMDDDDFCSWGERRDE